MEPITYFNLKVEGIPLKRVLDLKIENGFNQYGKAYLVGEIDYDEGMKFAQSTGTQGIVKIKTTAEGQPPILFIGTLSSVGIEKGDEYARINATVEAMAASLDKKAENKSYQQTSATYQDVITPAMGNASLVMNAEDREIGSLVMRYNETGWGFTRRMASALGAPISAPVDKEEPIVTVGIPNAQNTYNLTSTEHGFAQTGQGIGGTQINTNQAVMVGDEVSFQGQTHTVTGYQSVMKGGVLVSSICIENTTALQNNTGASAGGTGGAGGQMPNQIMNTQAAGKIFTGLVQDVRLDKVKVFLTDIDGSFDGSGDFWFPFSTSYSSSDGSGYYSMPTIGDTVRVIFPSSNEADAFVVSSVNVSPLSNPLHKKWASPGGKEILFTEEGLFIKCKDKKIFINMEDENGITIYSDLDVNINAMKNMTLFAGENLTVEAKNKILISSGTSYIDMTDKLIQLGADQVLIN